MDVVGWLLDSDPAIRWRALRDLTDATPAVVAAERARVATEGLGAQLLARQQADGTWRKGDDEARAWYATLHSLLLLRATGIDHADPRAVAALRRLVDHFRWAEELGGKSFFRGEDEPCINGGVVALGSYFEHADGALVERLIADQLPDGGWNCDAPKSACSSFHSTICVLEGLLAFQRLGRAHPQVAARRQLGEEYLLARGLFRRRSTGEPIDALTKLSFPPLYHYDVLRALDYFRRAHARPDPRLADAVRLVADKRQPDGRWRLEGTHDDAYDFPLDEQVGEPSRWITLRALRVLRWYDGAAR